MKKTVCILCGKSNGAALFEENGHKAVKCYSCDLIYLSTGLSRNDIKLLYSDNALSAQSQIKASIKKRLHSRHNLKIIQKFKKNGRLLELGAGAGYFLDEARIRGFEVYGTELSSIKAGFIRDTLGIPCEESFLDDNVYSGQKFDIVYHSDVISHFRDPLKDLKEINSRLVPGGLMVFETGNLPEIDKRYYSLYGGLKLPKHLFFYGENSLRKILTETGFSVVKIYRYSIVPHLLFLKVFIKLKSKLKPGEKDKKIKVNRKADKKFSNKRKMLDNIFDYLYYFLRYWIGYFTPKKGRPQKLLVISRKEK